MKSTNRYALPDGQVLAMPDHMTDTVEAFTMRDGKVVFAARVVDGDEATALRIARTVTPGYSQQSHPTPDPVAHAGIYAAVHWND